MILFYRLNGTEHNL